MVQCIPDIFIINHIKRPTFNNLVPNPLQMIPLLKIVARYHTTTTICGGASSTLVQVEEYLIWKVHILYIFPGFIVF